MEFVELYTIFLMISFAAVTIVKTDNPKCNFRGDNYIECKNLKINDYPLSFNTNNTVTLTLSNTENLPDYAFSRIWIEKLVIRYSNITNIAENAFSGHEDTLKILQISTEAKQVPAPTKSLQNLYNLENLKIFYFKLNRTFNNIDFANLSSLQSLHLENNDLFFFDNSVFKGLNALTDLKIKFNQFIGIPLKPVLADLTNLKILDMSDNKINKITDSNLQGSKNLEQLILTQNAIVEIEKYAFKGLEKSLEVLNLHLNKINHTQLFNMADIVSLKELNLQSNSIQALPKGIFKNFSHLQVLDLKYNKLTNIKKGSLLGLINLKTLHLSFNSLTVEAGTLLDTPQLQEIYFKKQSKNSLQMEWLQDVATSLQKAYLDENTFNKTSLWLAIRSLSELEYLSLSKCNLDYIPDFAFEQNRQLKTLNLNENGLQVLRQETFQGLQESLISLKLQTNKFQTIDECVFHHFNWSLQEKFPIKLYNNNLFCNCSLLWLQEWIQIYLAQIPFPITNVKLWKCAGSKENIYQANITCGSNTTNQTCQDFSDRYTTMNTMASTTPTYSTFAETTNLSFTLLTITKETTFFIPTTMAPSTTTMAPSTTTMAPSTTTMAPSTTTMAPSTTTMTPSTTTMTTSTTQTPNKPSLSLFLNKLSSSVIISWNISSWKHVQKFTLLIVKTVEDYVTENKIDYTEKNSTGKILTNLKKGTILKVCIQVKLDFSSKLIDECHVIHLIDKEKINANVGVYIGLGVGGAVLITLILIAISLVAYNHTVSKGSKPETDLNKPKTTLKTKRYQKRKTANEPQISVISAEPFQPLPRISAGNYQYLVAPNLTSNSTQQSQPAAFDNQAFTDINNINEKIEKNNNQNQSNTNRPLPDLPGSRSLIEYFQPVEPIYANVQPHYAEIPHTETII